MSGLRLVRVGVGIHVRNLTVSSFFVVTSVFIPVVIATVAFFMFRSGQRQETLFYASLGAGVMGIWSSTLFGSGGSLQWERWNGRLEVLVAAPRPFVLVLFPITIATAVVGSYSLVATIVWGRLLFAVPFTVAHWLAFVLALPATVLGLGMLGLLFASTFVLYRNANALSNMLEFPVLFVTGLLVPLSLLPAWVRPVGWVLAPTWGIRAIRAAALGGNPWPPLALTLGLGLVYVALATAFLGHFLRLARERATLSLT